MTNPSHRPGARHVARAPLPSTLKLLLPLVLLGTPAGSWAEPLTFSGALRAAETGSPDLAAKELGVRAARSAAIPAGALPDPKLFGGLEQFPISGPPSFSFDDDMTMVSVGVMQDVPNRATRRARVARAQAEVEVASAELRTHHREVAEATARAWLELFYVERRLAALGAVERENRILAETVPALIGSGTALPADSVSPGLESAALADRRAELNSQGLKARAELRRWVGAAADEPLASAAPTFPIDPAGLRAGLDDHPVLRAFEPALARAEAETREARAGRRPGFGVQAAFHARNPDFGNMVSAQVTVDLPVFASRRQDPLIAAKALQASRIRVEQQAARRRLASELDAVLAEYGALAEELKRARDTTLPLARRKAELQLASFRAAKIPFEPVLQARREQVEAELKIIELEAKTAQRAARLALYFGSEQP
ncbi:MAG: TolC family protein [Proteobacteria bacterium]|nr:TolC family protein [Pseudomonadota bacterium]